MADLARTFRLTVIPLFWRQLVITGLWINWTLKYPIFQLAKDNFCGRVDQAAVLQMSTGGRAARIGNRDM